MQSESENIFVKDLDEEYTEKLSEILELLIDAGYYRAKIQGISNFDKIVGGLVWIISLCARNVDVDLLYSENSTIGQKIALTEKIVKVLRELNCPFSLEPHQIQGLDIMHIFPIVQWLVKEANYVKERLGDEMQNFAVYQFDQEGWKFSTELDGICKSGVLPLGKRQRKVYKRVVRMNQTNPSEELDGRKEDGESDGREELVIQGFDEEGKLVYRTEGNDHEQQKSVDDKLEIARRNNRTRDKLIRELENIEEENRRLDQELSAEGQKAAELGEQMAELELGRVHLEQKASKETVEYLQSLLVERDEQKAVESAFKTHCREELARLDQRLEQTQAHLGEDIGIEMNSILSEKERKAEELCQELAKLDKEIARLSRSAGERPSQAEWAQYQRRFVELCNQIAFKHSETKRFYTLHNTLVDKLKFMRREIDLLNNIDDQREFAVREEYRNSLLEILQKIGKGVDESLDKMLCKKRILQEQRDQLQDQLHSLLEKQRMYTKAVHEFQKECQRSEQLSKALEEQ